MLRRRPGKPDADDARAYSRRVAIADSAWTAQDRVVTGWRPASRKALAQLKDTLERASFPLQEKLVWPLEDRAGTASRPVRTLTFGLVVLLAAGAGVAGLIWAAPDGPHQTAAPEAAVSSAPLAEVKAAPPKPPGPTLHGAAPDFKPSEAAKAGGVSEVDPAKAIVKSSPSSTADKSSGAASSGGATTASSSSSSAKTSAQTSSVDGVPAGPAAVSVARDFASAFVVYETGGADAGVRKAFGATATPALSRALLRRPPRLPANVKVPKAKVVNVVPAPSHGTVYPVSVSLLRVGLTSELRLEMEQLKGDGWRVTNVLG